MLKTEEGKRKFLWIFSAAFAVWNFIFYILEALSPIVWGTLLGIAVLLTVLNARYAKVKAAYVTAYTVWIVLAVLRWFAILWAAYECVWLGYDGPSCLKTIASTAALVFAIGILMMPSITMLGYKNPESKAPKFVFLLSLFLCLFGIYLHGVECFTQKAIIRLTEKLPAFVHYPICVLTALAVLVLLILSFSIVLNQKTKKEAV